MLPQCGLVQIIFFLSLANFIRTTPITTAPDDNSPALVQALPQCRRFNTNSFPPNARDDPSALQAREPVSEHTITVRDSDPWLVIRFFYCPELLIQLEAARRTLYGATRAMTARVLSEGYNAPLGRPFASEEERGINCIFTVRDRDVSGTISVGAVLDVLRWMRQYMVRDNHRGSLVFTVYMNNLRVTNGQMRPRVDPPGLLASS
ncbi:MAG: hypothetical protein LQ339_007728 [Xanthoria mediterranea]|nr:MAG: hypothetical protein LQ339_007728 [Xanthoria mediterranea]